MAKTIITRLMLFFVLLLVGVFFHLALLLAAALAWSIYEDLKSPSTKNSKPEKHEYTKHVPSFDTVKERQNVSKNDNEWQKYFLADCESPAEESFLTTVIEAFNLVPERGRLVGEKITLEMQVAKSRYRFDFLLNSSHIIEVDGAAWHSSQEQKERDRVRDEYCINFGYNVTRIPAKTVLYDYNKTVEIFRSLIDVSHTYQESKTVSTESKVAAKLTVSGFINEISREIDSKLDMGKYSRDFKKAFEHERMHLEAFCQSVEREIEIEKYLADSEPETKSRFEAHRARLSALVDSDKELVVIWLPIQEPSGISDSDLQLRITSEFRALSEEREAYLKGVSDRCSTDLRFRELLREKLTSCNYPNMHMIFKTVRLTFGTTFKGMNLSIKK